MNKQMPASPCVVVFAHGARDPAWAEPLEHICLALRQGRPGLRVELAFLELQEPRIGATLAQLVAEGIREVRILPVFVARGSHLRIDLPGMVAEACARHPDLHISILPPLGEMAGVIQAVAAHTLASLDNADLPLGPDAACPR